jgi:hypothetical protein
MASEDHDGDVSDTTSVWLFLVERGVESGSDLQLFWREADAAEAARQYLLTACPAWKAVRSDAVHEMVELANRQAGAEEFLVVAPFPVAGRPDR